MKMKMRLRYPLIVLLAAVFLAACATPNKPLPAFKADQLQQGRYDKKVDQVVFVLDASSSMSEGHQGYQKLDIARGVIDNFNATMPETDVATSLYSFGHDSAVSSKGSDTMLASQPYARTALASAVDKVSKAGGFSPLGRSIKDAAADMKGLKAPTAMVIISDGLEMASDPVTAAQALAGDHGNNLCIYTVQVGNAPQGKKVLDKIAGATGCGQSVNADGLASGSAMNAFVKTVLFTEKKDSDNDGVFDSEDKCPGTPAGVAVDAVGCPIPKPAPKPVATKSAEVTKAGTWLYKDIQFETNRSDLKASSYPTLNEIVEALDAQPGLKIEVQGHTDSTGAHGYNVGLSQKRAEAVKAYLVSKGIAASRMTTVGYGPDRPFTTNDTKEGRARNRRVEVKPLQ
jgi:OOP family OmpA-OmpF porin